MNVGQQEATSSKRKDKPKPEISAMVSMHFGTHRTLFRKLFRKND
jgi:hypothetical protein